ncbi:MAG TPA: MG2 domain-containing protein, partial [Flavitalea sp.]|nr:MG2 domain-containing protein [Flavitalea sp.]
MKISIRSTFLLLFVYGSSSTIYAQKTGAKIEEQLESYSKQMAEEKLFLHTDKDFYLAGEIVWFKIYSVDASFHRPLNVSKVAYVEILDRDFKPVSQAKVTLSDGSGNGSFYLPSSINSGVYRLRAYTQWMKNFSEDYFFQKPLTIVNATKSLDSLPVKNNSYEVGLFPEGGILVQGLESKLAFRITDVTGKGVKCKGVVVNQNRDTVAVFEPIRFGIGHFILTPAAGNSYKALINIGDTTIERPVPQIREQGFVMSVSNDGDAKIRVRIKSNVQSSNTVQLVIHTRQVLKLSEQKSLVNGTADFVFDKTKLGDGISHMTVFNEAMQPVCERLYFVRPSGKLLIESSSGSKQFSSRAKASIQVTSKDETGKSLPADLSVSVYRIGEAHSLERLDIDSYLWLSSDLRGRIESPGFYFSDTSAEVEQAADNLMLTHGWRKFVWQDIANDKISNQNFLPEFRDHIINARVVNIRTGKPAQDIITYLSVPGKRVQLYSSKSDSAGRLRFYTKNLYGLNEVMLQTDTRGDTSYRVEIINPFSEKLSMTSMPLFTLPGEIKTYLTEQNVGVQVQNTFSGDKLRQQYLPAIDTAAFYGPPDNSYMLDDYVRFSTMEEVLKEYVVEVLVRRQKENFRLMMSGGLENKVFLDDPITLFNGVPVFETNKIMQYDPLKVQKIDVVKRRYFYGPSLMNGIVN